MEDARQRHNRLLEETFSHLVGGVGGDPAEAILLLESLVARTLHHFQPNRQAAVEMLDALTARIVERLPD